MTKRPKSASSQTKHKQKWLSKASAYTTQARTFGFLLVPVLIGLCMAFLLRQEEDPHEVFVDHTAWEVVEMPAKFGKGVVAKRNITVSSRQRSGFSSWLWLFDFYSKEPYWYARNHYSCYPGHRKTSQLRWSTRLLGNCQHGGSVYIVHFLIMHLRIILEICRTSLNGWQTPSQLENFTEFSHIPHAWITVVRQLRT